MITYKSCLPVMKTLNETNDCTVKAVSVVTDTPYIKAHALLKAKGRPHRKGSFHSKTVIRELGYSVERIANFPAKTIATLEHYCDPKKRYIAEVRGHILAIVNGKIEDWTRGGDLAAAALLAHHNHASADQRKPSRRRINSVYEVTALQSKNAIRKAKRYAK